ncbi:hypothetical protein [Pseudacidovorax sp.]|uniref:hypothetical protein n=1 Tax=Pseudacidovorax sp. TaxID=1934311 RepID=UPI0025F255C7|nr:hypothetical protein [Pseudacidovorax sp.]
MTYEAERDAFGIQLAGKARRKPALSAANGSRDAGVAGRIGVAFHFAADGGRRAPSPRTMAHAQALLAQACQRHAIIRWIWWYFFVEVLGIC